MSKFSSLNNNRKGGREFGNNSGAPVSSSSSSLLAPKSYLNSYEKKVNDELDAAFGFVNIMNDPSASSSSLPPRIGWLINMIPTSVAVLGSKGDKDLKEERSGLELFFQQQDGSTFKSCIAYEPYFYVRGTTEETTKDLKFIITRKFENDLLSCDVVELEDLEMGNHLSGIRRGYLKLTFRDVDSLMNVRRVLLPIVEKNKSKSKAKEAYSQVGLNVSSSTRTKNVTSVEELLINMIDIREYDVPYYQRVCIDLKINAGSWYKVSPSLERGCVLEKLKMVEKAEPKVLAFDLECTKQPLKFPDATTDQIYMISYMFDGSGYLIINREFVSKNIPDFEYTPTPDYPGVFEVFNEDTEEACIRKFFSHVRELKPHIFVTYNGDSFDFPFLQTRAKAYKMTMEREIGIGTQERKPPKQSNDDLNDSDDEEEEEQEDQEQDKERGNTFFGGGTEFKGRCCVHIDCLYWVKRDSYLPAGSRGLKAVTKAKLGYDPVEVDAEDMMDLAQSRPEHMASYSVSDAVATYYLYSNYIHLFVFSLCTIIPMNAEDVLRKGSGTLCESLLMVEARSNDIVCPNKQRGAVDKFHNGKLMEVETYVGGHVECLESGVFRNDIPIEFHLDVSAFDELLEKVDRDIKFAIEVEQGLDLGDCLNYDEVKTEIKQKLALLKANPHRVEAPKIYHLDVGAMYPNIILTNRLQPCAVVNETVCATCVYNKPDSDCKREMNWDWRAEVLPGTRSEYKQILTQLEYETVNGQPFRELWAGERSKIARRRFKEYCQFTYKRVKDTVLETRKATICQRENPFYVDTVRAFRDRRNEYKAENKKWGRKKASAATSEERVEAETKVLLYDSLQLAHKCILNSFYGYVMRKGARWHSMEMAAVVTRTGSDLIKQARVLVERVGKPLELDTDGIWCVLPSSFPEIYSLRFRDGEKETNVKINYPCVMLNADVHANFTNHQYQTKLDGTYEKHSECSIFFEVDGPYACMVLPASQEEGKLLKKRYAVFDMKGRLSELKGFELKRRGELKIVKIFQSQIFEHFLDGASLQSCYESVAAIANFWLDVLYTKGVNLTDKEVIDLLSENRTMSKSLAEYGAQKSSSITTAKRLTEFLGMQNEKGVACQLLIAKAPVDAPTAERAIPTAIFSAKKEVQSFFLRKWLKDKSLSANVDVRSIIDWEYYIERLSKTIQKIITIPAALQMVENPVPRVKHPEWLAKIFRDKHDSFKQKKIESFFKAESEEDRKRRKEQREKEEQEQEEEVVDDLPVVKPKVGFNLEERKKKWKENRLNHKRKAMRIAPPPLATASLVKFVNETNERSVLDPWQILEVRPSDTELGFLNVFVVSKTLNVFRKVNVKMRRTFYIDSKNPNETLPYGLSGFELEKVVRSLPHEKPALSLYKVTMEEKDFQRNSKEFSNYLSKSEVVGVYESRVPLSLRYSCNFGNCVEVKGDMRKGDLDSEQLRRIDLLEHNGVDYLEAIGFKRILLFHAGSKERQIVALFFINDDFSKFDKEDLLALSQPAKVPEKVNAHVWFCGYDDGEKINLDRALREEMALLLPFAGERRFETAALASVSVQQVWESVDSVLDERISDRTSGRSFLVCVQCRGRGKEKSKQGKK